MIIINALQRMHIHAIYAHTLFYYAWTFIKIQNNSKILTLIVFSKTFHNWEKLSALFVKLETIHELAISLLIQNMLVL